MNDFHFLRPWWLLCLFPCIALIWFLRAIHDPQRRWRSFISPELLPHLLIQTQQQRGFTPITLLAIGWGLAVAALAGPTWQREPAPFGDDTAVLVIVLKVTPSMLAEDIAPTRQARSVQKIHDLLAERPGAKTALIAYSGSAHQVLPLTTDAAIMTSFAGELAPNVMPSEGDAAAAALNLADQLMTQSGQRGWILWIADAVDPAQLTLLEQQQQATSIPVTVLAAAGDGPERQSLTKAAASLHFPVVLVTPDGTDVGKLAANTQFSVASTQTGERWRDSGYWLVPILSTLCLYWFRRGWMIGDASC